MHTLNLFAVLSLFECHTSAVPLIVGSSTRSLKSVKSVNFGIPRHSKHQYKHRTKIVSDREISPHDRGVVEDFRDARALTWIAHQPGMMTKDRSLKTMMIPRNNNYAKVSRKVAEKNHIDQKNKISKTSLYKLGRRVISGGSTKAPVIPSSAPSQPSSKVKSILSLKEILFG